MAPWLSFLLLMAPAQGEPRAYDQGPLQLKEFRGEVPEHRVVDGRRMDIGVYTEMRYRFRYQAEPSGAGVTLTLSELEGYAVLLPDRSWHARSDQSLLPYARGYFDLAQIWSLRAAKEIFERHRDEEPIEVTAATREQALELLQAQLNKAFGVYHSSLSREQEYYAEQTDYGRASEQLKQIRQRQQKTLAQLTSPTPLAPR